LKRLPNGGSESAAFGTPMLPFMFASGLGAKPPQASFRIHGRHRAGRIQEVAQRQKPLGRGASPIQLNLAEDASLEAAFALRC